MRRTLTQILVLGGGYFIISSLFAIFSDIIGTAFALMFPLFLVIVIILAFLKPIEKISLFNDKHPNITLLLSIIGVYTYVYFAINLYGIILESIGSDNNYINSLVESYNYWYDIVEMVLSLAFVVSIGVSFLLILYKNIRDKKS